MFLADAAEESQLLKGAVFAFDGFTGFTPVQMKLLHRCMHVVKDMYVTVTLDVREDPLADCGMQDLFYMSRKMTAALLRAAREEQFPLEDAVFWNRENRVVWHRRRCCSIWSRICSG